jgi:hypothetical protein
MKYLVKFNENNETEKFIKSQRDDKKIGDSDISSGAINCKFCSQCGKTNDGVTNPQGKFCGDCGAYKIMAESFTPDHKEVTTFAFVPRK